jgi:O-antigen/teichoic acid export membrane protein
LLVIPVFAVSVFVYSQLVEFTTDCEVVLYLVSAATALTLLAEPFQAGFQATERMQYLAYSDIINKAMQSLIGIAIVSIGFGAVGIGASMAGVAASVVVLNTIWIRRFIRIDLRTTWTQLVELVKRSFAYWAFAVFAMLYLWIDTIMLSLLTRPEVVGWYGAPLRLFQTLMFLPVLLSTAWLPRMVSAWGESREELLRVSRKPVELVLILSAPMAAGTAMVAGLLVPVLYGQEYKNAVPVMILLGLCLPPMYVSIMLSNVLIAAGRQKMWTWIMITATFVNPLFNLVLIPYMENQHGNGAIGAALSLLLTEIVLITVGFWMVGRDLFDGPALRRCLWAFGASGIMYLVWFASKEIIGEVPAVAVGVATFLVLGYVLRIVSDDEIAFVRDKLRGRLSRRKA